MHPLQILACGLLVIAAYWQYRRVRLRRLRGASYIEPSASPLIPALIVAAYCQYRFGRVGRVLYLAPLISNVFASSRRTSQPSTNQLTPIGFENHCADLLRQAGWAASLTPHSGDQGADIIARRDGVSLVVQCKLYSGPVGNSAVQEAIAARLFYGSSHAAVVSNQCYTSAAHDLANRSNVLLIAPADLNRATSTFM